eukprot:8202233-Karenia_brevis.AAC.1
MLRGRNGVNVEWIECWDGPRKGVGIDFESMIIWGSGEVGLAGHLGLIWLSPWGLVGIIQGSFFDAFGIS